MKNKIVIIGGGNLGSALSERLAQSKEAEIVIMGDCDHYPLKSNIPINLITPSVIEPYYSDTPKRGTNKMPKKKKRN